VLFVQRDEGRRLGNEGAHSTLPPAQSPRWREAPTRTLSEDIGSGIVATISFPTGHHGFVAVVGESHYQDVLRSLAGRIGSAGVFKARLVPEPDNPHDATAVAVWVDDGELARPVAIGHAHHPMYTWLLIAGGVLLVTIW
jgi:hypothetical protein